MAIVYKDCDEIVIPQHVCDDCSVNNEKGGIRSIALIDKDFDLTTISMPATWLAGINAGKIIIVPATRGTFDGGSAVTTTGYGDNAQITTGYNFTLTARDPAYRLNKSFWNAIAKRKNMKVAYRTATLIHVSDVAVSITPTNPVEEGLETVVDWQISFTWSSPNLPEPHDATALMATVFTCFELEDAPQPD
jgi:hypothetical protein